jgi:hypothetical protein
MSWRSRPLAFSASLLVWATALATAIGQYRLNVVVCVKGV